MTSAAPDAHDVRRQSAHLRDLGAWVVTVVGLVLLSPIVSGVITRVSDGDASARQLANQAGLELVWATPGIFYLCALWALRRTFAEMARADRVFAPALARGLRDVGSNLTWGAGMEVLGAPLLLRWIDGESGGAVASFSVAAIALGVVGLSLFLLARLLARAAAQEAELRDII